MSIPYRCSSLCKSILVHVLVEGQRSVNKPNHVFCHFLKWHQVPGRQKLCTCNSLVKKGWDILHKIVSNSSPGIHYLVRPIPVKERILIRQPRKLAKPAQYFLWIVAQVFGVDHQWVRVNVLPDKPPHAVKILEEIVILARDIVLRNVEAALIECVTIEKATVYKVSVLGFTVWLVHQFGVANEEDMFESSRDVLLYLLVQRPHHHILDHNVLARGTLKISFYISESGLIQNNKKNR